MTGGAGLIDELLEELFAFLGDSSLLFFELDELDSFFGLLGSTCFGELGLTGILSFLEELEEEL